MKLPNYIGIKDSKFRGYTIKVYEHGLFIGYKENICTEEALLNEIESIIQKGLTFEVFYVEAVVMEYEDEDGNMREFER